MRKRFSVILLLFLLVFSNSSAEKINIGILPFDANNVENEASQLVTQKFQEYLLTSHEYNIIEQSAIRDLLEEANFSQSGCTDANCYADFGKKIGVQKLITGQITMLDKILTLSVRLINVSTSRIEKVAFIDSKKDIRSIDFDVSKLAANFLSQDRKRQDVYSFNFTGDEPSIAVIKLTTNGIDPLISLGLTDRLAASLLNTGQFDVIERQKMEEILVEQGFQQSGCTDQACAVEIGRLINVKYMVAGSITKINNNTSITTRIIDVSSGRIIKTASSDTKKTLDQIVKEVIPDLANALAGNNQKKRINKPFVVSLALTIGSAITTGYCIYQADDNFNNYNNEVYNAELVTEYRTRTKTYDMLTYTFSGLTAVGIGTTIYFLLNRRDVMKVQNSKLTFVPDFKRRGVQVALKF